MMTRLECTVPRALLECDDPDAFVVRLAGGAALPIEPRAHTLIVSPGAVARCGAPVLVEWQPETRRPPEVRHWPVDEPEAMRVSAIVGYLATFDVQQAAAVA